MVLSSPQEAQVVRGLKELGCLSGKQGWGKLQWFLKLFFFFLALAGTTTQKAPSGSLWGQKEEGK